LVDSHSERSSCCIGLTPSASGRRGDPSAAGFVTSLSPLRNMTPFDVDAATTLTRPVRDHASAASASAMSSLPFVTLALHRL
jgi:hypothetical protein